MLEARKLGSMILWGPPGCGKTTIARLLAEAVDLHFEPLSAVFSGVADLRKVFEAARQRRKGQGHAAVRRRDPPLQPRPAGRLPALCRGRHGHARRRHHREPVLRTQRRAAVALPGAGAAPPRRCGSVDAAGAGREAIGRKLPVDEEGRQALFAMADGDGRYMLGLAEQLAQLKDAGAALAAGDAAAEARAALRQGRRRRTTT
jgi:putative ATPase